eukprot:IDg5819t1
MSCLTVSMLFVADTKWEVAKLLRRSIKIVPGRLVTTFIHVCERGASEVGRATQILFEVFSATSVSSFTGLQFADALMEIFVLELRYHP